MKNGDWGDGLMPLTPPLDPPLGSIEYYLRLRPSLYLEYLHIIINIRIRHNIRVQCTYRISV